MMMRLRADGDMQPNGDLVGYALALRTAVAIAYKPADTAEPQRLVAPRAGGDMRTAARQGSARSAARRFWLLPSSVCVCLAGAGGNLPHRKSPAERIPHSLHWFFLNVLNTKKPRRSEAKVEDRSFGRRGLPALIHGRFAVTELRT